MVLEVCERASANETSAKEAMKALRKEFKYVLAITRRDMSHLMPPFPDMQSRLLNCLPLVYVYQMHITSGGLITHITVMGDHAQKLHRGFHFPVLFAQIPRYLGGCTAVTKDRPCGT